MVAVLQPRGPGRIIAVDRAVVLIGRSADCDAVLKGSQKISRRHCCLVQVDDEYYVRDLGSMNGVWLNGTRVDKEARLSAGDNLAIGDVEFLFHPNARLEPKKSAGPKPAPQALSDSGETEKQIDAVAESQNVGASSQKDARKEILDDVIPLDQLELLEAGEMLVETNEVPVIDAPVLDTDEHPARGEADDDDLDEIIVFED